MAWQRKRMTEKGIAHIHETAVLQKKTDKKSKK